MGESKRKNKDEAEAEGKGGEGEKNTREPLKVIMKDSQFVK